MKHINMNNRQFWACVAIGGIIAGTIVKAITYRWEQKRREEEEAALKRAVDMAKKMKEDIHERFEKMRKEINYGQEIQENGVQ